MINTISPAKHAQRAELAALMAECKAPITTLPPYEPVQRSPHKAPSKPAPKRAPTRTVQNGKQRTQQITKMREMGLTYSQIGAALGLAESSIRGWMRIYGGSNE